MGRALCDTYEFRFRRRYNLPPTDPRFLAATYEDIVVDYWANAFLDNPDMRKEDVTDDFAELLAAMEAEALDKYGDDPAGLKATLDEKTGKAEPKPPTPEPRVYGHAKHQPTATQEVVSGTPEDDDWEDLVSENYGSKKLS